MKTIHWILLEAGNVVRVVVRMASGHQVRARINAVFAVLMWLTISAAAENQSPKYVFLFIGDGMGETQVKAAELALKGTNGGKLSFRSFPVSGSQRTQSLSSGTTDSAAAGTAIACGVRTRNGMLGMSASNKPLASIAARAHKQGWKVGILTSVSIDHATPAAFYAHSSSRSRMSQIAAAMAESPFDFFGGGGMAGQKDEKSKSGIDNLQKAISNGFAVVRTKDALAAAQPGKKVFAFNHRLAGAATLPWALETRSDDISLAEFTAAAIRLLKDKPFFMMVEGGRIDYACHANDLGAMVREVEAFDRAISVAADFAAAHPGETLIVVTADHETGGLSSMEGVSARPDFVLRQTVTGETFMNQLKEQIKANAGQIDILARAREAFGFTDFSKEEKESILQNWNEPLPGNDPYANVDPVTDVLKGFVAERAGFCFHTASHTGADIPVYATGAGAGDFAGTYDNTGIYDRLARLMLRRGSAEQGPK